MRRFESRPRRQRGSALIEVSLLAPWILFLFVGAFDMGFYSYCMVGVENAARVAAEYTSKSSSVAADSTGACTRVLAEMTGMPNVGTQANCTSGGGNTVVVTASSLSGPDSKPATQVSVTYTGNRLIPIPGLLIGQLNITRTVEMRVKP
jgi:Flp pilus assembly protein TadG